MARLRSQISHQLHCLPNPRSANPPDGHLAGLRNALELGVCEVFEHWQGQLLRSPSDRHGTALLVAGVERRLAMAGRRVVDAGVDPLLVQTPGEVVPIRAADGE